MNDFLPILSGLAGGLMQGLADKHSRQLKAATLARQIAADTATAKYREDTLGLQRGNAKSLAERNAFDDISTQAKALGTRISNGLTAIGKQRRGTAVKSLADLQRETQPNIQAFRDYALNRGLSPIQVEGILRSNLPYGFLGDGDTSVYLPQSDMDRLNKLYQQNIEFLGKNPEMQGGNLWQPFATTYAEEFPDFDPENPEKMAIARGQFPLAFPHDIQIPKVGARVPIQKTDIPDTVPFIGDTGRVGNTIYEKQQTIPDGQFSDVQLPAENKYGFTPKYRPSGPVSIGSEFDISAGAPKGTSPISSFVNPYIPTKQEFFKRDVTYKPGQAYMPVPTSPQTQATMLANKLAEELLPTKVESAKVALNLKKIQALVKSNTIDAESAWPSIRNNLAVARFNLAKNHEGFTQWYNREMLKLGSGRLNLAGSQFEWQKMKGAIDGYGDFAAQAQRAFETASNNLGRALAAAAMTGLVKLGVDSAVVTRVANNQGTQDDIAQVNKAYADNPAAFRGMSQLNSVIKQFNDARKDKDLAVSTYGSMSQIFVDMHRKYDPYAGGQVDESTDFYVPGISEESEPDLPLPEEASSVTAPVAKPKPTAKTTPARIPEPGKLQGGSGGLGRKIAGKGGNVAKPSPTPSPRKPAGKKIDFSGWE